MEILLLIAIIAVGASGLYVAATFNTRTRRNFAPLMDSAEKNISSAIAAARGDLERQMKALAGELRDSRELLQRLEAASGELREKMKAITEEVGRNSELAKHIDEQAGVRQNQLGADLAKLERRVAEFSDSLSGQSSRISAVYRYVMRRELPAGSSEESESLLLAMLEAESYVDDKGWGGRPHLYALTEQTPTVAADGEPAAGKGARPDALVLVDLGPLPDDDVAAVLGSVHWPADVVGCVLVAELAALPPGDEEDVPIDPVAAGQRAGARPDGRAARLAVGVRRGGEHTCGLRVKGEDEIQVRTDIAGNLVTALLRTF